MQLDDLALLLALQPDWTLSINRDQFIDLRAEEIQLEGDTLRCHRVSRKVLGVQWLRPDIVRIRARSRMRSQPDDLLFVPAGQFAFGIEARRRRKQFQKAITPALQEYFGRKIDRHILNSDKQHGIGGAYPRFLSGGAAAIAVDAEEPSTIINGIMRAAIQWSGHVRKKIAVVVPAGRKQTLSARLSVLPRIARRFEWLEWDGDRLHCMRPSTYPETHVQEYYRPAVDSEVARLCSLAPELLQAVPNIPARAVSIRLRGIEVAQVSENGTSFPLGQTVEQIVERLARERSHGSRHPLAKMHEESWLESMLLAQIENLLPVRPGFVYPQVPSFSGPDGSDRRIIDLLAITTDGRLLVIEIKAACDPELPFQALDYWLAVERHRISNDFKARGYFPGIEIADRPAVLVMVAPLFLFHRTFERLTSFFPKTLPILQIGINQGWKKRIKILRRRGSLS